MRKPRKDFPIGPRGDALKHYHSLNELNIGARRRWRVISEGDMHLCGGFDIIPAQLFAAQTSPFPALVECQFGPSAAVSACEMMSFGVPNA